MAANMLGRPAVRFGDDDGGGGIDLSGFTDAMNTVGQIANTAGQVVGTAANLAGGVIKTAAMIQSIGKPPMRPPPPPPPHVMANQIIHQAMQMPPPGSGPLGIGGAPGPAPGMQVASAQKSWLWPLLGVGVGGMLGAGIGWLIAHNVIGAVAGGVVVGGMGGGSGYLFNRLHVDATMALNTKAGSVGLSVAKA
jgi:hypothetical protein